MGEEAGAVSVATPVLGAAGVVPPPPPPPELFPPGGRVAGGVIFETVIVIPFEVLAFPAASRAVAVRT